MKVPNNHNNNGLSKNNRKLQAKAELPQRVAWLTQRAHRTAVTALLSAQVLLIAHGAHPVRPGVAVETAACGAQDGYWTLIGLLGHCC